MGGWGRAGIGCLMALAAVGLLLLVPLANRRPAPSVTPGTGTPGRVAGATPPVPYRVRYYIHGTPGDFQAQINYVDPDGGIQQVPSYQGPWDKVQTIPAGRLAEVAAREIAPGTADQSIICEIQLDGKTWRTQQAQGANAQVRCQGVLGGP